MSVEPPNPYAPGVAVDGEHEAQVLALASRWLAVLASLFVQLPMGVGLYLLGRKRRFFRWAAIGLVETALFYGAALANQPKLFLIAGVALLLTVLAVTGDTALAGPVAPFPPFRRALLIALVCFGVGRAGVAAIKAWLLEGFSIPSAAMSPTLLVGDHVFVRKGRSSFERGDAIVFRYPPDPTLDYVKRVIAQEGDVVRMRDDVVSINGGDLPQELVDEPCRPVQDHAGCRLLRETDGRRSYMIMLTEPSSRDFGPITVPPGKVFVLGDNRDNSSDSRFWGFVPVENIKGAVWLVWWSRGEPEGIRWDRVGQPPGQAR